MLTFKGLEIPCAIVSTDCGECLMVFTVKYFMENNPFILVILFFNILRWSAYLTLLWVKCLLSYCFIVWI